MSPKNQAGFATCRYEQYLENGRLPFYVEGQIVLVLDQDSLDGQVLGLLCEGDVALVSDMRNPWLQLPEGSSVRHPQKRSGCTKLKRHGWIMKEHPKYGILLREYSRNMVNRLFQESLFLRLPTVKVINTGADDNSKVPVSGTSGPRSASGIAMNAAVAKSNADEDSTTGSRGEAAQRLQEVSARRSAEASATENVLCCPDGISRESLLWLWAGDFPETDSAESRSQQDDALSDPIPCSPADTPVPRKPWPRPRLDGVSTQGPWEVNSYRFFCDFDSGNCAGVVPSASSTATKMSFDVLVRADNQDTEFEALECQWFYFGMRGTFLPEQTFRFQIMGLSFFTRSEKGDKPMRSRLLVDGLKPVVSAPPSAPEWRFVRGGCDMRVLQDGSPVLAFDHQVRIKKAEEQELYFALFFPYPLATLTKYLGDVQRRFDAFNRYVNRELLCSSLEGRPVELLTITAASGQSEARQPPLTTPLGLPLPGASETSVRPSLFPGRRTVFVSARVHPGETPASFVLEGLLDALASNTSLADKLLQRYVFHVIPVLNPDGVFLGHHRTDTRGENLNRVYGRCNPDWHPSIYAAEAACSSAHEHQGGLRLYLDLHAHSSKRSIFFLGDDRTEGEVASRLYAYALARRCPTFEYSQSLFADQTEGTGKTGIADKTGAPLCFTLESNYRRGHHSVEAFGPGLWRKLGCHCLEALLDLDEFEATLPEASSSSTASAETKKTYAAKRLQPAYAWLTYAARTQKPASGLSVSGPSRAAPFFGRVKMKSKGPWSTSYGEGPTAGQVVELIDMQNVSNSSKRHVYGAKQCIFKLHECHGDLWLADEDIEFEKHQRGRFYYRTLVEVAVEHEIKPSGNILRLVPVGTLVEAEERRVVSGILRVKLVADGVRQWSRGGWASEYACPEFDPRLGGTVQLMRVGYLYPSL